MKTFKTLGRQMMTCMAAMALTLATGTAAVAQTPADWEKMDGDVVLYMANDLGRNGYYEQKPVAELMGRVAETTGPELIIAAGDVHHFKGVASVNDPLWMTNYELIYSHPELMLDWNPIMGNHEYRGNTQAVIDYSKVSRRWDMPARYYTKVVDEDGTTVRIVFIDTTPLISKYREETDKYPDAARQDNAAQLEWLDNTLKNAKEDWVIVVGHHPIYAQTSKDDVERQDMQRQLLPILHKYGNVAIYACGHIHNYQHIKMAGDDIDYVVNTSGSLARKVEPTTGTVFCAGVEGFSVISATKKATQHVHARQDGQGNTHRDQKQVTAGHNRKCGAATEAAPHLHYCRGEQRPPTAVAGKHQPKTQPAEWQRNAPPKLAPTAPHSQTARSAT